MSRNTDLHARRLAAVPQGWGSVHPIYVERACGAELWDADGRRYIDFASGIAVLNTGHLHPRVKKALAEQLEHFTHTCFMVAPYESAVALCERLNRIAPGPGEKKTLLLNSGAEAVENAVKIARAYSGRSGVIAFRGGFHGRTFMAMALTGKVEPYKSRFGPVPGEVFHAPYPYDFRGISVAQSLDGIAAIFAADIEPSRVAAIVIEPVLGEGGFVVSPPELLAELRALCDRHGIVLIVDEVQTGFARSGRMFAIEYAGIEPDLLVTAKSLAGGVPLSAVTGKTSIMDSTGASGLGGTYGGSPLGCAAALAVLDTIEDEGLVERAAAIGHIIRTRLQRLAETNARIGEVRGLGAMIAIELVRDPRSRTPDPAAAAAVVARAREFGLILLTCGSDKNVVRFLPPLTIADELLEEALGIVEQAVREACE